MTRPTPADGMRDTRGGSTAPASDVTDESPGSAPRRTFLAAERTYLAWLRTGLGALGIAIAVGRLIPALIQSSHVPFALLGAGYGLLGAFLILFAAWRTSRIRRALEADEPLGADSWALTIAALVGFVLAVGTIVLVFVEV